jgi:WD40 repeat protein/serine/threonine protein kinase/Tfp pilus assembly protein PilF
MNATTKRAKEIFLEAVKIAPDRWDAYLVQACAGDEDLRGLVSDLLGAHKDAGSFLGSPAPALAPTVEGPVSERPGSVVGLYKLMEQIGEGGMGLVFVAEQQQPVRRKVALKVIKPGMDTRQVVARFEVERQALALMDHPNIAKVLDGGRTASGRPYFVMELVKGVPITAYCDQNQIPVRERLELFVWVCQAVQHAHLKGIIHRDLKPSNVLVLSQDGTPVVKVIDFGVAKAIGQQLTDKTIYTQFDQLIGTPLYMSPEQAGQSSVDVDTRTDIYALGVLLYELLTGTTPFDRERLKDASYDEIRRIIREEEPPRPSTRLSTLGQAAATTVSTQRQSDPKRLSQLVRGELDWIVMKALEKDRNRRYETANAFVADVQRYLHDEPVQACPPSAGYRLRKLVRRNRALIVTVGLVATALMVGTALSVWQAILATSAEHEMGTQRDAAKLAEGRAETQRIIAQQNLETAKTNELLARRRYYAAQMNRAMQAWETGQVGVLLELLEEQRPKYDQEDLRTFEWYYLWHVGHPRQAQTLRGHSKSVGIVAFSPDGRTLASQSKDYVVKLWDLSTGKERGSVRGGEVGTLTFSPDGKILATGGWQHLKLWDVASQREWADFPVSEEVWHLAFSPDGKTLLYGGLNYVRLLNVATGAQEAALQGHPGIARATGFSAAFSPEGKILTAEYVGSEVKICTWDGATWREKAALKGQDKAKFRDNATHGPLPFSPDGKVLTHGVTSVTLWDVTEGKERATFRAPSEVSCVAFAPDGKSVAAASNDRIVRVWDLATGHEQVLGAHLGQVGSIAYSPDSRFVATACDDTTVTVWALADQREPDTLSLNAQVDALALAPDHQLLAARSPDGGIKLWDLKTGKVLATLQEAPRPGDPNKIVPVQGLALAFSPDSKLLVSNRGALHSLWDVARRKVQVTLPRSSQPISALAFTPNGQTLAIFYGLEFTRNPQTLAIFYGYHGDSVKLWDLSTEQARASFTTKQFRATRYAGLVVAVAFSPNGKTLAGGLGRGVVGLWETDSGKEKARFVGDISSGHFLLVFSPDGQTVAQGCQHGIIRLLDVSTGQLRATLKGHADDVRSLCFFPDGKTLASGSQDQTVRLWDVATGQERCTLKGHAGAVLSVSVAPDGQTLVTGSTDGTVKFWRAAAGLEARAPRMELDPNDPAAPSACIAAADALWGAGQLQQAEHAFRQAQDRLEKLAAQFPEVSGYRQELTRCWLSRSLLLSDLDSAQEAENAQRQARELVSTLSAEQRQELAYKFSDLASSRLPAGRPRQEVERTFSRAIELKPDDAEVWRRRAAVYFGWREYEKAFADLSKAIALEPRNWSLMATRASLHAELEHWEDTRADYAKSVEMFPDSPLALNNLAWFLATCPDQKFRDSRRALELAEKAVKRLPQEGGHWNTLGIARFRTGDWKGAIETLNKSEELLKGKVLSFNAFFLAMAHWQLGQKAEARQWYDKAIVWMEQNRPQDKELHRFRAEAEKLLGVSKK